MCFWKLAPQNIDALKDRKVYKFKHSILNLQNITIVCNLPVGQIISLTVCMKDIQNNASL